ncbi:type II toxin-antitoxin system VapC family toxin [Paraburkholderia humisilvae]|uniref:Ribonuclease VapC n=1 Tax=Paraburkholderia humisilvae TaxID=627669 RepID=A0A6J5D4X9_9BURK|nr:type II toxin-antitoxin system VapC family toxin [Paraburkholderia humisilvae]CAB3748045.1 Toxin FitB [Paraburkholderia humisilvae]
MIVLDTNVLSETMKPDPDDRAMIWFRAQSRDRLFTTAITKVEMLYGLRTMEHSERKEKKSAVINAILNVDFAGKVLSFDRDAARRYAEIFASRKEAGRPIEEFDAMIAAIAQSKGAILATRNVKDFVNCDIEVVNPWAVS